MRRTSSMEEMSGPPKPRVHLLTATAHEDGPEDQPAMKFKLGFEFQESSGLCPWALNNTLFQKTPFFELIKMDVRRPLWHLVVDSDDIEFVTEPFTYNERKLLKFCIRTILEALEGLKTLVRTQSNLTFETWMSQMEQKWQDSDFSIFYFDDYERVQEASLIAKSPKMWEPSFKPQTTIQHPLEFAIPLYFGFFGFNSRYMPFFSDCFPFREYFLTTQSSANITEYKRTVRGYLQKISGLIFLHALTLEYMSPIEDTTDEEKEDSQQLIMTQKAFHGSHQMDAKLMVPIMSRRPFSLMCKDINFQGGYEQSFRASVEVNLGFRTVIRSFSRTNYAEQHVNSKGEPRNLLHFFEYFNKEFALANEAVLVDLLKHGVISTTMIRNIRDDIPTDGFPNNSFLFNELYNIAIRSVDFPQKLFIINTDNGSVQSIPWKFDVLSLPCFLDCENSMGRFKNVMTAEELDYGEAIVEIRAIDEVQSWFLRKCNLSDRLGTFLKDPGPIVETEALALFDFLKTFGSPKDYEEIFYLGIPSVLHRN